jgi:hypothetical protein
MQRMLAEEVPVDKPVWGVHNDASRGLEAGARFGDLKLFEPIPKLRLSRYATTKNASRACCDPPGSESMTCRLQEIRPRAPCALAARMARVIALTAPTAPGLFCASSHEPSHADGGRESVAVTERSGQEPSRRCCDLPWSAGQSMSLHCRIGPYLESRAAPPRGAAGAGLCLGRLARRTPGHVCPGRTNRKSSSAAAGGQFAHSGLLSLAVTGGTPSHQRTRSRTAMC